MTKTNPDIRRELEDRLGRLLSRVGRIEDDLRRDHARDWTERAIEIANDEVLEELDTAGRAEVDQIRAALTRMDAGLYGVCIECGRPVGDARLAAMPTALRCMACGPTIADRGGMP